MTISAEARWPAWTTRVSRFALVGGLATALHWATMAALVAAEIDARAATAWGAVAGAVANYILQRRHTFASHFLHHRPVPRYAVACLLAWALNLALFSLLHALTPLAIAPAQLLTTATVAGFSYLLYSRLVFHESASRKTVA